VLLTYGLILMVEEARSLLWGDDVHGVPVPASLDWSIPLTETLSYPVYRLFISGVCLAVAAAMALVIQKTRVGMWVRAGATNREMTEVLGIDVGRLSTAVFAAGVALAALAGMIAAPVASVFPGMGNQILIISFVVVVIGGIGSIKGALVAALLIGLVDTFGAVAAPKIAGMSVYLLMAAVLLWRPSGLFGRGS
jgi:branched-chain amino acid transport system permease protein